MSADRNGDAARAPATMTAATAPVREPAATGSARPTGAPASSATGTDAGALTGSPPPAAGAVFIAPVYTVAELAAKLGARVEGDPTVRITGLNGIREAAAGELTFLADERYAAALQRTKASAVLVRPAFSAPAGTDGSTAPVLLRVADPAMAVLDAAELFAPPPPLPAPGVHPTAVIHATAVLGADIRIGPHVVVEAGARIGDRTVLQAGVFIGTASELGEDCHLWPNVTVRDRCRLGRRVVLHPGCVIGADGFGYRPAPTGLRKIPHIGIVILEDDVEVGANACIDRARFAATRIGAGTKIDNLVQIAHNVVVGRHSAISGMTGVAGSATIGNGVIIGGHVGIRDHVTIGDRVTLAAMTGVHKDLEGGKDYSGQPARPHRDNFRVVSLQARLPELWERLKDLEKQVAGMAATLAAASTDGSQPAPGAMQPQPPAEPPRPTASAGQG